MKKARFIFFIPFQRKSPLFRLGFLFALSLFIYGCVVSRTTTERSQAFFIQSVPGAYTEDVTMEGEVKTMNADTVFIVYLGWNKRHAPLIDTVWVSGKAYRAIIQKVNPGHHFIGTKRSSGDSLNLTTNDEVRQYFRLDLAPIEGKSDPGKSGIIIKGMNRGRSFKTHIEHMTELSPGIRM